MVEDTTIIPTEIGIHRDMIQAAQKELASMDILVCGQCRGVFHISEEFQLHKQKACMYRSIEQIDSKEIIWAFLLWKQALPKNTRLHIWSLYQKFLKTDENTRDTWIVAGKTIQHDRKASPRSKCNALIIRKSKKKKDNTTTTPPEPTLRRTLMPVSDSNNGNITTTAAVAVTSTANRPDRIVGDENNEEAATISSPRRSLAVTQDFNAQGRWATRKDRHTGEITVEIVDKIIAKRPNNRKLYDYLVKWDSRPNDQNTWEPVKHFAKAPSVVEEFEKLLAKQQAPRSTKSDTKTEMNPTKISKSLTKLERSNCSNGSEVKSRPARISKTKAMDNVKQWIQDSSEHSRMYLGDTGPSNSNLNAHNSNDVKLPVLPSASAVNSLNEPKSTPTTIKDLEEYLIPKPTFKRVNNQTVEVKSKQDKSLEALKANKYASVIEVTPANSAKLIFKLSSNLKSTIRNATLDDGIPAKKPRLNSFEQVRILTHAEAAVMSSGIVKLSNYKAAIKNINIGDPQRAMKMRANTPLPKPTRDTVPTLATSQFTPVECYVENTVPSVIGGGTVIKRKSSQSADITTFAPTNLQSTNAPSLIISHSPPTTSANAKKAMTLEQKILQLSKSCDLKVTRKVISREVAESLPSQHGQQALPSQVEIQRVQQPEEEHQMQEEEVMQQLDASQLLIGDQQLGDDNPAILVTGEDGIIYQVMGKNAEGQTILVSQAADGEQQFAYVCNNENEMLTLDDEIAEAVALLPLDQQADALNTLVSAAAEQQKNFILTNQGDATAEVTEAHWEKRRELYETLNSVVANNEQLSIQTENIDGQDEEEGDDIPAEIVHADMPSPGGTRRVVLMLQDGRLVMTEMPEEQFESLNFAAT